MEEDVLHANCPARLIVPSQGDENIHLVDNGLVEASRRIPAMNGQGGKAARFLILSMPLDMERCEE